VGEGTGFFGRPRPFAIAAFSLQIRFVFLFFITENVASEGDLDAQWKLFPTTIACEYATDCPEITIEPDMVVVVCLDGFCQEGPNDPSLP
jgi:steroid 5-alpha reductase family enzyme